MRLEQGTPAICEVEELSGVECSVSPNHDNLAKRHEYAAIVFTLEVALPIIHTVVLPHFMVELQS